MSALFFSSRWAAENPGVVEGLAAVFESEASCDCRAVGNVGSINVG